MKNHAFTTLALFTVVLSSGCFVEVDDPEVTIVRTCDGTADCTIAGVSAETQDLVPLALANGTMDFAIDLGDKPVVAAQEQLGLATLDSVMALDQLALTARDGIRLDGVSRLHISRVAAVGCASEEACKAEEIARFDLTAPTVVDDPATIVMTGSGMNLLTLGTKFVLRIEGSGRLPVEDWMVDLTFKTHLYARAQ